MFRYLNDDNKSGCLILTLFELAAAATAAGLEYHGPFEPQRRVLECLIVH